MNRRSAVTIVAATLIATVLTTVTVALWPFPVAYAQASQPGHEEHHAQPTGGNTHNGAGFTEGEVRKVDKDSQKITLRHGPIANLEMPEMTMVFRTADSKMLEQFKPGDKVRFKADRVQGQITLTEIELAN